MANTFAPSEQAFDKVDLKAPAHGDSGAVTSAQAAYQIGTKVDGVQKSPADRNATAVEITPIWNSPQSNSNAMRGSDAAGSKDAKTGWEPYEALNLDIKKPPIDTPQSNGNSLGDKSGWAPDEAVNPAKKLAPLIDAPMSNLNSMDGSGKRSDTSGWAPYEALDLQVKPVPAIEK